MVTISLFIGLNGVVPDTAWKSLNEVNKFISDEFNGFPGNVTTRTDNSVTSKADTDPNQTEVKIRSFLAPSSNYSVEISF